MSAYSPSDWSSLYAAVTSAAAALTGLLFIALSLGPRQLLGTPEHRGRAREALFQFVAVLVIGVLVQIPDQGSSALGVELIATAAVMVVASARFQGQTIRQISPGQRLRWLLRVLVPDLATLAIGVAGISVIVEAGGGLFWLVGAALTYLVWSCANAWQLIASDSSGTSP